MEQDTSHSGQNGPDGRKLRINWILPRVNLSGGVKSNRLIAEAMQRRGHEVTMAFVDKRGPWPPLWRVRVVWKYLQKEWKRRDKQHHMRNSTTNLVCISDRNHIIADDVPDGDVCIGTWWKTTDWIDTWPDSKGAKVYFIRHHELHGGDPEEVKATYRRPWLKLVIAKWLQRVMAEEYGDPNAVLIPNGVDWKQFDSEPRKRNATPVVGFLFGDVAWKGADTAFEAMRLVQREVPELRVVAFGAKPIGTKYELPDHFTYHHRPAQTLIPKVYQSADCWVVPSTTEGFGMPGIEAAACHCPLVVTQCGGPEDYTHDGENGYIVEVGNAEEMAQRVLDVIRAPEDEWERMSAASYAIAQEFNWDVSAEKLERALVAYVEETEKPQVPG